MPSLRERVRTSLARTEPGEREARDELATILARARGEVRPWWRAPLFALAAAGVVAAALVLVVRLPPRPAPPPRDEALHLYLHVEGEPLDRALTLNLTTKGEH